MPGNQDKELSSLVKWSEDSGAMWLHMLLSCGFNDFYSLPFSKLRDHVGTKEWRWRNEEFYASKEMEAFVTLKLPQLTQYEKDFEKTKTDKAALDSGKMTEEEFIATLHL